MGLIWDLIQQSQISEQSGRANTLEKRVESLEKELFRTQQNFLNLLRVLEQQLDADLDGDGQIG